jgi:hypothetical protein
MLVALKSGCQSDAEFWAAVAELKQSGAEQSGAEQSTGPSSDAEEPPAPKKRGPKPLAERTPEQQAAHAAKMAARKAGGSVSSATGSEAEDGAPKKRGPKPLAERTPEQQAAHAAKMAAKKAGGSAEPKQQSGTQKAWIQLCSDTVKEMNGHGWAAWKDPKSGTLWSGSTLNAEGSYVFAEGVHAGKTASNQRGGMARASYIKSQVVGLQGGWAEMDVDIESKEE